MIGDNGEDHEITDSRIVSVKIGTLKITDIVNVYGLLRTTKVCDHLNFKV
jgi:hypothetical protein